MEVINAVVMAGGQRPALPNQARSWEIVQGRAAYDHLGGQIAGTLEPSATGLTAGQMMADSLEQEIELPNYGMIMQVYGPVLYVLRPGDYTVPQDELNYELLQSYGIDCQAVRRLFFAGYFSLGDSENCLNFFGIFDRDSDPDYARCFCYIAEVLYECSLPLISGLDGKAALAVAPLYALYCDHDVVSLNDIRKEWLVYSSFFSLALLYEE